ncbi:hypothetical protein [Haloarcula amylovorans]|uniref:hypothetical protein n=1 Tax=Haloarcula amylovorans TaxID=2562280 RepID=UPI0010768792|nr:hypothetical protein [Halomicroarcula amylolytica]
MSADRSLWNLKILVRKRRCTSFFLLTFLLWQSLDSVIDWSVIESGPTITGVGLVGRVGRSTGGD